ncbi:MAG TPA: RDD family protein [Candidatus Dormibacteraeota bacterium]|nr:RDD family protein [Candidatus Dormibacteraeota bacterium]
MLVAGQSMSGKGERPASTKVAKPGGFLPRLIALIVDSLILLVVLFPVMTLWTLQLTPVKVESGVPPSGLDTLRGSISLQLTLLLLQLFYFAGSWTIMGATPGQLLMSLRVTDQHAAGIGFPRAVMRYFLYVLLSPLALVSALMVGVSKNKRALHDLLAGTYVIQIVERDDLVAESGGLPAALGMGKKAAPATAPPIAPAAAPAPAPPLVPLETPPAAAAAYSAPPTPSTYSPPPTPSSYSPAVPPALADPGPPPATRPPLDFPAMPMMGTTTDVPPPPDRQSSSGGVEDGLYAPPPMVDPATSLDDLNTPAPSAPSEREIYQPQPGPLDPRAARSAEPYAAPPQFNAPPEFSTPPPPPPGALEPPPAHEGELSAIEFPPMAPPPEPHK